MNRADAIQLMALNRSRTRTGIQVLRDRVIDKVGASILQTPGGATSEISQIDGDVLAFDKEINHAVTDAPGFPHTPQTALESFYEKAWSPFIQNWQAWKAKYGGWSDNFFWNHAPEAEQYREQLITLREEAQKLGMDVMTPAPMAPTPGLIASLTGGVVEILKGLLWVAVGVIGVVLILRWVHS
jgi:hypothetical protein